MTKIFLLILTVCAIALSGFSCAASTNDWYVRLVVTAPDDPLPVRIDNDNLLGRWHDSVDGLDGHDLVELPPDPGQIGDRYLSIVFPHPEWNGEYENYAYDFRGPVSDEIQGDSWKFEVRTRTPGIKTIISWQEWANNPFAALPGARIKDFATGAILVEDTSLTLSYTVNSTEEVHAYIFEYLGQPPAPPMVRAMPWINLLLL